MTIAIFRFTHHSPDQHFHNVQVDLETVGRTPQEMLAKARTLAQPLNDYDTADFAAAFVAANKTGPWGVTLLPSGSWRASAPEDTAFVFTTVQFRNGHVHVFAETVAYDPTEEDWLLVRLWERPLKACTDAR